MSTSDINSIPNNSTDIEGAFCGVISRLNLSNFRVKVGSENYSVDAITHQHVFLPRLALRAEELSVLLLGVRLFTGVAYTVKNGTASGFLIQEVDSMSGEQLNDPNFTLSQSISLPTAETMTASLQCLLMDLALTECFEVDVENQILLAKPVEMEMHKAFKITANYQEGQCIPLLPSEYLSANELQAMARGDVPLKALNKARRIAEELATVRQLNKTDDFSDSMDKGI